MQERAWYVIWYAWFGTVRELRYLAYLSFEVFLLGAQGVRVGCVYGEGGIYPGVEVIFDLGYLRVGVLEGGQ